MDVRNPFVAVVIALAISVANSSIGYLVSKRASMKEMTTFMVMVFGSMAARALVVFALAYYLIGVLDTHKVAFALTFSISSFVVLMVEVFFFHSSMEKQRNDLLQNVKQPSKKKAFNELGFIG